MDSNNLIIVRGAGDISTGTIHRLARAGFPVLDFIWFTRDQLEKDRLKIVERAEQEIRYPMFVKPASLGSSIGVSKAGNGCVRIMRLSNGTRSTSTSDGIRTCSGAMTGENGHSFLILRG